MVSLQHVSCRRRAKGRDVRALRSSRVDLSTQGSTTRQPSKTTCSASDTHTLAMYHSPLHLVLSLDHCALRVRLTHSRCSCCTIRVVTDAPPPVPARTDLISLCFNLACDRVLRVKRRWPATATLTSYLSQKRTTLSSFERSRSRLANKLFRRRIAQHSGYPALSA